MMFRLEQAFSPHGAKTWETKLDSNLHPSVSVDFQGYVRKPIKLWLQIEAVLVLVALLYCYWRTGASWLWFVVFLLAPDIVMIAYFRGTRLGALAYNAAHSYIGPLIVLGLALRYPLLYVVAIIWAAHIAFDRAQGYGLKYSDSFHHTHLGIIGRKRN